MKRSRKLVLTTLMAAGGVSLTACGDSPADTAQGKTTDAYAYQSLQECKDKNEVPDDACETGAKNAKDDENAEARYADTKTCEDVYGPGYEDSQERVPDIAKARRLLGWMPLQSLSDMLPPIVEDYVRRYGPRIDSAAARSQVSVA